MADIRPMRAPAALSKPGRTLWKSVAHQLADDGLVLDARDRELLEQACREADVLAEIEDALVGAPKTVKGAQGQIVAHPLIGEARRSRTTMMTLLGKLDLADPTSAAGGGSGSRTTPWQARAAAQARHRAG